MQLTDAKRRPLSVLILRDFCLFGTQHLNPADHVAVAGRRREDVGAFEVQR